MSNRYDCPVKYDAATNSVTVTCEISGAPVDPIRPDRGDDLHWHVVGDVKTLTVKFYGGPKLDVPCTRLFEGSFGNPNGGAYYHGDRITNRCGDTIRYEGTATLANGATASADPIIIVGKAKFADIFTIALAVGIGLLIAAIFYNLGRAKERRMQASRTPS